MLRWIVAVLIVAAVVASLAFIKISQVKAMIAFAESFPEPSETVETTIAQWQQWSPEFFVLGEIKAKRATMLSNELEGIVEQVNLVPGQLVKKGELLIQLNVQQEKAQLQAALARIDLAKLDVSRLSRLNTANAASKDQLDRATAQLKVAEAEALALEAAIDKKSVYAPFDGVVGLHDLDVGEYLAANSAVVNIVAQQPEFWVDFTLPQNRANIAINDKVKITDTDGMPFGNASVIAIEPQLTAQSRSLPVRATVPVSAALAPGKMVQVGVPVKQVFDVIRLPIAALRFDSFGSYVYVLESDEQGNPRAKRNPVTVQYSDDTVALISSGLDAGAEVATTGSYKLTGGKLAVIANQGGN